MYWLLYSPDMTFLDKTLRSAGVPSLDPNASRYTFYGGIIGTLMLNVVIATVIGFWARGAIVWAAPYKLYAALAFWILWKLPEGIVEAIKVANRTAPKCPCCDDGPHRES